MPGEMPPANHDDVTHLLVAAQAGDRAAISAVWQRVYRELHALAARHLGAERRVGGMQTTSLLHEAFLRLTGHGTLTFENRAHFFGAAARAMRRILVDGARARDRHKRGAGRAIAAPISVRSLAAEPRADLDLLALDEAMQKLQGFDPRKAQVVELRFFAGLRVTEVAEILDVSVGTVSEEWKVARLWLFRELSEGGTRDGA